MNWSLPSLLVLFASSRTAAQFKQWYHHHDVNSSFEQSVSWTNSLQFRESEDDVIIEATISAPGTYAFYRSDPQMLATSLPGGFLYPGQLVFGLVKMGVFDKPSKFQVNITNRASSELFVVLGQIETGRRRLNVRTRIIGLNDLVQGISLIEFPRTLGAWQINRLFKQELVFGDTFTHFEPKEGLDRLRYTVAPARPCRVAWYAQESGGSPISFKRAGIVRRMATAADSSYIITLKITHRQWLICVAQDDEGHLIRTPMLNILDFSEHLHRQVSASQIMQYPMSLDWKDDVSYVPGKHQLAVTLPFIGLCSLYEKNQSSDTFHAEDITRVSARNGYSFTRDMQKKDTGEQTQMMVVCKLEDGHSAGGSMVRTPLMTIVFTRAANASLTMLVATLTTHAANASQTTNQRIVYVFDATESSKWLQWQSMLLASSVCVGVMLILILSVYAQRHWTCACACVRKEGTTAVVPGVQQDSRNVQELIEQNAFHEPAFGMAEIGPPTKREGAPELTLDDVVFETPNGDPEGETAR